MTDVARLFDFEGHEIHVVARHGELYATAESVAEALGVRVDGLLSGLGRDEKIPSAIGETVITLIPETAVYYVVGRSRSDVGKRFMWRLAEIVKEIRQTGGYISPTATAKQLARLHERINYLQLRDLLAEAVDYDRVSPVTRRAFAYMQNCFHLHVTGMTGKEIVASRAGQIQQWTGRRGPTKADLSIAKNYLTERELRIYQFLCGSIVNKLGLKVLLRDEPYTMAEFVDLVAEVLHESPVRKYNTPGSNAA